MVNFEIDLRFHYESNPSCPGRSFSLENISQNEMLQAAGCSHSPRYPSMNTMYFIFCCNISGSNIVPRQTGGKFAVAGQ